MILVSGSWSGEVSCFGIVDTGDSILCHRAKYCHDDPVLCVDVSSGGDLALSGSCDRRALSYDVEYARTALIGRCAQPIQCIKQLSSPLVLTGSWDGAVSLWDRRVHMGSNDTTVAVAMAQCSVGSSASCNVGSNVNDNVGSGISSSVGSSISGSVGNSGSVGSGISSSVGSSINGSVGSGISGNVTGTAIHAMEMYEPYALVAQLNTIHVLDLRVMEFVPSMAVTVPAWNQIRCLTSFPSATGKGFAAGSTCGRVGLFHLDSPVHRYVIMSGMVMNGE